MMISLPPCFVPDDATGLILSRVREGYDVSFEAARPLIHAGLLYVVTVPTAGSGYELTDNGTEALLRYYERELEKLVVGHR